MKLSHKLWTGSGATLLALAGLASGCAPNKYAQHPAPLGTTVDPFFMKQEENAEASDFVIHEFEFQADSTRLNEAGQDHVKQIAARAGAVPFPIIVGRSKITPKANTTFQYPVHMSDELDLKRRAVIVEALTALGVADAERRVLVAPYLTFPYQNVEAEQAYLGGILRGGGSDFVG